MRRSMRPMNVSKKLTSMWSPSPVASAPHQRDRGGGGGGRADLAGGRVAGGLERLAVGAAGVEHRAAHAPRREFGALPVAVRPALPEVADRGQHDGRVRLPQRLVPQSERVEGAGAEALDRHVAVLGEPQHRLAPALRAQVDGDRALVGVEVQEQRRALGARLVAEERRHQPRRIALAGPLDLDHVGPVVAEHARAVRPGDVPAEVEHAHVGERQVHHRSLLRPAAAIIARPRSCARRPRRGGRWRA